MNPGRFRIGAAADTAPLALAPFDPAARAVLAWRQEARARRRWRLEADGRAVAELQNRGVFGQGWRLRLADGEWAFRSRWLADFVAQRADAAAEGTAPLRFRHGWFFQGRMERAAGATLVWKRTGFWRDEWALQTEDALPLVRYRARHGFLRLDAEVEFEDAARRLPDLPLLLGAAWVVVLSAHRSHSHSY